jgi:arsenate reductase-like glutaredoxin family protein
VSCGKTQEYLAAAGHEAKEEINARNQQLKEKDALALAATVNHIYAAKGKKVVYLNMKKDKPGAATLRKVLLGPTGNLRAPALRKGKTLVVGFNEEMYREVFG